MNKLILLTVLFTVSLFSFEFEETTIKNPKVVENYYMEDLNGDGYLDLFVLNLKGDARDSTSFTVYINNKGKFDTKPSSLLMLSRNQVLFDFGNILSGKELELITLSGDSMRVYSLKNEQYYHSVSYSLKNNLLGIPAFRNALRFKFVQKIRTGDSTNFLIPGMNKFTLYTFGKKGIKKLKTLNSGGTASYYQRWNAMEKHIGEYLNVSISPPFYQINDVNGDGKLDIVFYSGAKLSVFLQGSRGFTSNPTYWSYLNLKDSEGKPVILNKTDREKREWYTLLSITDSNNDGALDVFIKKQDSRQSIFDPSSQMHIYYGKLEGQTLSFPQKPDKIIVSEGFQFNIDFADIDGNGYEDIAIPAMKMGLFKLIAMLVTRSATISVNFYKNDGTFPDLPTVIRDISMSFDFSGDFKTPVFDYEGDFNGDGVKDLLTSPEEGWVGVHYGGGDEFFPEEPDEEFEMLLPRNGNRIQIEDFNNDGLSDIIYRFDLQDNRDDDQRDLIKVFIQKVEK